MGSSDEKYPWPSTVNVASFVTVKPCLEEAKRLSKFNIWKEQMLCLLESQEVLGFVNGEILEPQSSSEEHKLWRRTDRLVKGWILGSICEDDLDAVWKLETAREVWLELEKIFNHEAANTAQEEGASANSERQSESDADTAQEEGEAANSERQSEIDADTAQEEGEAANSEPQSESDADTAQEEDGGSEDLSRYLPLYRAALCGDWETAKSFFDKDKDAATAAISDYSETVLHVAVLTGKANDFVKKLVEFLPREALAIKDDYGDTALHNAGEVGNTEAAITLVSKNPDLLYSLSNSDRLPVLQAAIYCQKDTVEYLISMSKPNVENSPFDGEFGISLLNNIIGSEFFDVALNMVDKYPNLARLKSDKSGLSALLSIADMSTCFLSGERFSWWEKWIYRRIPPKQHKWKAADQVTSLTGDIENGSRKAPVYKECFRSFQSICGVSQKLESMLWKVLEYLVPQVEDIRDKKAMHQQALELVKCLCQQMVSLPQSKASTMFKNSITKAAKYGISEIVEVIAQMYPMATSARDSDTNSTIFLLAARYRFENVFNIFYSLSDRKYQFFDNVDNQGDNLMHICGKLAPPDRLNLVRGAALQMQRELQWFKEMEKFVHPSRRIWTNKQNKTPKMLFTEEHQQLKADGERWMKDTANACTIAAALIATVVFAAAFTVPGGVATETGIPLFSDHFAFILFAISDALSLFTSITSLLMFLSILTSRYAEEDFLYVLPKRLTIGLLSLFISITFMMIAFSATLYLLLQKKMAWFLIPVAAFACLPVTSFVLLQFPLLAEVAYSTYGPGIFGKKSDCLFY